MKCPHCGRDFPDEYPFKKDGSLNEFGRASAMNNFISHRAACKYRGKRKPK